MLLVANVPVKLLTRPLDSPLDMLWLVLMSAACFAGSEFFGASLSSATPAPARDTLPLH